MVQLMDCTLRDGANVVGKGFNIDLTKLMLDGLTRCGIRIVEMGNALGIGAYDAGALAPLTDEEYMGTARPYLAKAEIGMFMGWRNGSADSINKAAQGGMAFLRVGANAGEGAQALEAVHRIKKAGMTCRFSLMKAYLIPPEELAEEAKLLAVEGVDEITIMDSAGTMQAAETAAYVRALKHTVSIPVAFHGHNNLGMAASNAMAAAEAGADVLDCGLMGMARSAGNIATELAAALLWQKGSLPAGVDLWRLMNFVKDELAPAMAGYGYRPAIPVIDLVLGLAGTHSSFLPMLERVAGEENADLLKLIVEVSKADRCAPDEALMRATARRLGV